MSYLYQSYFSRSTKVAFQATVMINALPTIIMSGKVVKVNIFISYELFHQMHFLWFCKKKCNVPEVAVKVGGIRIIQMFLSIEYWSNFSGQMRSQPPPPCFPEVETLNEENVIFHLPSKNWGGIILIYSLKHLFVRNFSLFLIC